MMKVLPTDIFYRSPDTAGELANKTIDVLAPVAEKIEDIPHTLTYRKHAGGVRSSVHIGQRKLFCNKVQFLTKILFPDPRPINVVYAGSAPSNTLRVLCMMFPTVKWLLVDPNPFHIYQLKGHDDPIIYVSSVDEFIKSEHNINIINDYMTVDIARDLAQIPTYFISDIRTNSTESHPDTVDILWNNSQQYNWIKTMNPILSMLKFRHPFYNDNRDTIHDIMHSMPYSADFKMSAELGIDFKKIASTRNLIYFDGEIMIQPWAGKISTETRLITDGKTLKDYGTPEHYENLFNYYNNYYRCWVKHENSNADKKLGFDYCNDCALENKILTDYVEKSGMLSVKQIVEIVSAITKRPLIMEAHGYLFDDGKKSYNLAMKQHRFHGGDDEQKTNTYPFVLLIIVALYAIISIVYCEIFTSARGLGSVLNMTGNQLIDFFRGKTAVV